VIIKEPTTLQMHCSTLWNITARKPASGWNRYCKIV